MIPLSNFNKKLLHFNFWVVFKYFAFVLKDKIMIIKRRISKIENLSYKNKSRGWYF